MQLSVATTLETSRAGGKEACSGLHKTPYGGSLLFLYDLSLSKKLSQLSNFVQAFTRCMFYLLRTEQGLEYVNNARE